ncbi:hypothetical protein Tco_1346563 [Tanacetum coccineum]
MHFLLSSMSVVYVLTTHIPEDGGDDATVEQIRKRNKWDNDDYVCRGLILKGYVTSKKQHVVGSTVDGNVVVNLKFAEVIRLPRSKAKNLSEKRQGNLSLLDMLSIPRLLDSLQSLDLTNVSSIPKGTEDIGGSVVPEVVTDEVVQQPEYELRKSKKNRTPKDFGPEFQLYLIKGTRDEKEAINDEMESIMGNNTWVLADLPLVFGGYTDASGNQNTEENSYKVAGSLSAVSKEAEWLKNFLLEILLWVKPMARISIRCDSAATLAKGYSQMYNGKSRHLGVRHSMIRELITNGVISIKFVRS